MIIKVEQTRSNFKNRFEITVNDELKYYAGTPWMNLSLPMDAENKRRSVITGTDDSVLLVTSYRVSENAAQKAMPMRWLFTGSQKSHIYSLYDGENDQVGKFYSEQNGMLDIKYIIEYGEHILKCYDIGRGKTRNVFIRSGDTQIAEIVKPLAVSDNLDKYEIYLLDEYSELETVIAFFAVYWDARQFAHNGEAVAGKKEVRTEYTYDKNSKLYDKNWIAEHFGIETAEASRSAMEQERTKVKKGIKIYAVCIITMIVLAWVAILAWYFFFS